MQIADAIKDFNPILLESPEGRRALTETDPLLFALIYFPHHLRDFDGAPITLCGFHIDIIEYAKSWMVNSGAKPMKHYRDLFLAPRQSGKSTWSFLLLPMWAGAHGHKKFVAAFSNKEEQAEGHLKTFKFEIESNELLREDYPEFTTLMLTQGNKPIMNNSNQIQMSNGFIFMAKGVDTGVLGMKVGQYRPDILLFDDIEPGESNYSAYQANQRRETLQSDLFMLNAWAHVTIVGTTTMPDSLIDQMRKFHEFTEEYDGDPALLREALPFELRWVFDENIKTHYWPVIMEDENGEYSMWPERWDMDTLNRERHTRVFQKNMMNKPVSTDGGYWEESDIEIDEPESYRGPCILSVDPAVTTAKNSDFTGMAVLQKGIDGKIYVRFSEHFKVSPDDLRKKAEDLVEKYGVNVIITETNQGGDLWKQVFGKLNAKYVPIRHNSGQTKSTRASQAFDLYRQGKVVHTDHFGSLVEEMLIFPKGRHDDALDAVTQGVLQLNKKSKKVSAKQFNYLQGEQ